MLDSLRDIVKTFFSFLRKRDGKERHSEVPYLLNNIVPEYPGHIFRIR